MDKTNNDFRISNRRYYFSPFSIGNLLLERELYLNNIEFTKNYVSTRQLSVVYTFFEKDIDFVDSVLAKIEKDSIEYEEKHKKIKKQKKLTSEEKQKKIAVFILILISIIISLSMLFH